MARPSNGIENALVPYTPDQMQVQAVVMALPDEEAEDGASLGPDSQEPTKTDLNGVIKGIDILPAPQQKQIKFLITNYSSNFQDSPPVADLPSYHLDTGQTAPISKKPYRTAFHWKEKLE